jgi:hypothetical protein
MFKGRSGVLGKVCWRWYCISREPVEKEIGEVNNSYKEQIKIKNGSEII